MNQLFSCIILLIILYVYWMVHLYIIFIHDRIWYTKNWGQQGLSRFYQRNGKLPLPRWKQVNHPVITIHAPISITFSWHITLFTARLCWIYWIVLSLISRRCGPSCHHISPQTWAVGQLSGGSFWWSWCIFRSADFCFHLYWMEPSLSQYSFL